MFATRNSKKYLRFKSPTQLLIQAQWWSKRAMHLQGKLPCHPPHWSQRDHSAEANHRARTCRTRGSASSAQVFARGMSSTAVPSGLLAHHRDRARYVLRDYQL